MHDGHGHLVLRGTFAWQYMPATDGCDQVATDSVGHERCQPIARSNCLLSNATTGTYCDPTASALVSTDNSSAVYSLDKARRVISLKNEK